ncbi:MAG TPA: DMT family transporter [Rhodanobacteraceae bacterium]
MSVSVASLPVNPGPSAARGYVLIHICVVLWGFTPIMGRVISLDALDLVWWRMLLATAALLLLPATWRGIARMNTRLVLQCCGVGVVLAIAWWLFYLSIKLTNASVGAVCLGTAPLFIALCGPLLTRRPFKHSDLVLAIAIIPGVALVVGGIPAGMYAGFGVGLLSAACLAGFSSLNKWLVSRAQPLGATCLELASGAAFLTLLLVVLPAGEASFAWPHGHDMVLLLVFAVVLTSLPMALMLLALRSITAFAQQMATNLEPVYAVIIAVPLLGEGRQLDWLFYLGMTLIVGAVMVEPIMLRWHNRRHVLAG